MHHDSNRDLFLRLGKMERCCTVKLESFHNSGPSTSVVRWRVTITPTDGRAPAIIVEGDAAVDVLRQALDRAELAQWHR